MMKKSLVSIAAALVVSAVPGLSFAEDAPAASPITFNAGVVTDYRYRGVSQSRLKPALQGGVDYAGPNGIYLGTWASTIKWIKDAGTIVGSDAGNANFEWDLYGGWKGEVASGLTLDVGLLSYVYPSNKLGDITGFANANTTELYGALTVGVATLKYSHSLTNLFGFADSKNSGYFDLSAGFDVGNGITLTPHLGYQKVTNTSAASYTDYALTVSKDFSGWVPSLAVVGTDNDTYVSPEGKNLGKTSVVLGLKYNF